jgi:hypothetical protein
MEIHEHGYYQEIKDCLHGMKALCAGWTVGQEALPPERTRARRQNRWHFVKSPVSMHGATWTKIAVVASACIVTGSVTAKPTRNTPKKFELDNEDMYAPYLYRVSVGPRIT